MKTNPEGNTNYNDTTDPNCIHCKGRGFHMSDLNAFHTCIYCNPEGDHRQSFDDIMGAAEENRKRSEDRLIIDSTVQAQA